MKPPAYLGWGIGCAWPWKASVRSRTWWWQSPRLRPCPSRRLGPGPLPPSGRRPPPLVAELPLLMLRRDGDHAAVIGPRFSRSALGGSARSRSGDRMPPPAGLSVPRMRSASSILGQGPASPASVVGARDPGIEPGLRPRGVSAQSVKTLRSYRRGQGGRRPEAVPVEFQNCCGIVRGDEMREGKTQPQVRSGLGALVRGSQRPLRAEGAQGPRGTVLRAWVWGVPSVSQAGGRRPLPRSNPPRRRCRSSGPPWCAHRHRAPDRYPDRCALERALRAHGTARPP